MSFGENFGLPKRLNGEQLRTSKYELIIIKLICPFCHIHYETESFLDFQTILASLAFKI